MIKNQEVLHMAEKKAPAKKVYHVSKRAEDGKWALKFAGGEKVIKLFDTKAEAEEAAKKMGANQDATVLVHNSKGAKAGKIAKAHNTRK